MFDWSKPLRTQDGLWNVVAIAGITKQGPLDIRSICIKRISDGTLMLVSYDINGRYSGQQGHLAHSMHLVPNVERRWKWIAVNKSIGSSLPIFLTSQFYKDQSEANRLSIILLVKCEDLFEDTPIP